MLSSLDYFKNRTIVIGTQHGKEKVIAPWMERRLELICVVPDNFDTDQLGTFTGEVERKEDAYSVLKKKCLMAMEMTGLDLGIASEGSFGPHSFIPFSYADEELLLLIDKKNNLEIATRLLSTDTNFNGKEVSDEEELLDFAEKASFPSHALILRNSRGSNERIIKGLMKEDRLLEAFRELKSQYGSVYVETDMRASYNPSRMKVIDAAAEKLTDTILSQCPKCSMPGFRITETISGLPCSICKSPTRSIMSHLYQCSKCDYEREKRYPNNKTEEDPMYCDNCNP
jgi:hypothetical protein